MLAATSVQLLMCYILISLLCAEEGGVIHDDGRVSVAELVIAGQISDILEWPFLWGTHDVLGQADCCSL